MSRRDGRRDAFLPTAQGSEALMEDAKARELLQAERARVERLLKDMDQAGAADREAANEPGDMFDSAEPLTTEGTDASVKGELEERLAAVDRAEQRMEAGTYGLSVRSGQPIPDDRLEADPTAELTVEEAR
jgi:DnaK suppressor protein